MKTNILMIMCDQLRYEALTNDLVITPNLDKLRERGVNFTNAYSQTPVCIPARHSLISGQHAFEIGLNENSHTIKEIRHPLPKLVRDAGYYTCAIGKMHFVPTREHFGFDHLFLAEEIPSHREDDEYLKFLRDNGYGDVIEPNGVRSEQYYVPQLNKLPKEYQVTAWVANRTVDALRKNKNRPFFIFSSFVKPHPPFAPAKSYVDLYDIDKMPMPTEVDKIIDEMSLVQNGYKVDGIDKLSDEDKRKIKAYYYASVSQVDDYLGRIFDTLEEEDLLDKTMVIFTADHGEMLGDHNGYGKRTYYEESCKIPFVLSYPSVFKERIDLDNLVILPDLYATILKLAGNEVSQETCGLDLTALCKDGEGYTRDRIYGQYGYNRQFKAMIRWDKYKYVYMANGAKEFLFDLDIDPLEKNPIESSNLFPSLKEELKDFFKSYGVDLPSYDYEPFKVGSFLNQAPRWHLR